MTLRYPITLTPDDNDTFLVTCPDLPEVTTFGETIEEAVHHAADAIEEAIACRIADGLDVPEPSPQRAAPRLPSKVPRASVSRTVKLTSANFRLQVERFLRWRRRRRTRQG